VETILSTWGVRQPFIRAASVDHPDRPDKRRGRDGPNFCGVLWSSANGHEIWTQCGTRQLGIVGSHATQIRLAWLLPTNTSSGASVFAW
jgi:hypothetical protein